MCKLITIKCDESEARGARGRTSHWPRGKRRAHGKAAALAHSAVICERGPPQSVRLQPPTRKHSLLRVLKRSSGPPSARRKYGYFLFSLVYACGMVRRNKISVAIGDRGRRPLARHTAAHGAASVDRRLAGTAASTTHRLRHRARAMTCRPARARLVPRVRVVSLLVSRCSPLMSQTASVLSEYLRLSFRPVGSGSLQAEFINVFKCAASGGCKGPIKGHIQKSLSEMGYRCGGDLEICKQPRLYQSFCHARYECELEQGPVTGQSKGKRKAISSSSGEDSAGSDCTVVGSDEESESATNTWDSGSAGRSSDPANSDASFSLVQGKNKRQGGSGSASCGPNCLPSLLRSGRHLRADGDRRSPFRSDCTRLHINYSKAVRVADDGIKMICPNVETFRSLKQVPCRQQGTIPPYALEERKIKAVIRGIPADFASTISKRPMRSRLSCALGAQGHDATAARFLDGARDPPTDRRCKKIFNSLRVVCGLSGIRVEAPFKRRPGQCHRCKIWSRGRDCHAEPAASNVWSHIGPRVPAHSGVAGETLLC
ncbi:hypothetical protein EVAR_91253_1 [Eumeta japonica]|uniref:Uncharacterized protein n=1 Tax=Eumeta variegata TaxID=151549 RepID=A0A4C2A2T3_EUMVA|nr:hypothetical protein EVAR_91253_1 [Eumeta japonica]